MASVEYRFVYGDSGYRIGSDGTLWTRYRRGPNGRKKRAWKQCKPTQNSGGYLWTRLLVGGVDNSYAIHRLVLEAFEGPCPDGMECRHKDGNQLNNRRENLAWGTPKENANDRKAHGTHQSGEAISSAKLNETDVANIRARRASGEKLRVIAAAYGVHNATISRIATGNQWAHSWTPNQ